MKNFIFRFFAVLVVSVQFFCCADSFPSSYVLALPDAPEPWISLLGPPNWRLEWLDPGGKRQTADILPGQSVKIELPVTWANPVTAWPYWPGRNIIPGLFKPAGALFPFDVSGETLRLSWEAGPDTVFYWELAFANNERNYSKIPANFDWLRFRELFTSGDLNEAVRKDPWLVDWRSAAEKTTASNFDRRRLVPEAAESTAIPVHSGPWHGASPFAQPLSFAENEPRVFPVRPGLNVWISQEGILRVSGKTWVFLNHRE
jgi:hypothetical protein